jgi:hypothetical protein
MGGVELAMLLSVTFNGVAVGGGTGDPCALINIPDAMGEFINIPLKHSSTGYDRSGKLAQIFHWKDTRYQT